MGITWTIAMMAPSNIMSDAAVRTPRIVLTIRYVQNVNPVFNWNYNYFHLS